MMSKRAVFLVILLAVGIPLIGASITVSVAGHHGAQLVHVEGVRPQGKYLESHQH